MNMDKVKILNVDVLAITQGDLLRNLKKGVLITPNLDHLVKLQKDREFYEIYQQAEWIVCDSTILYFLSKILKKKLPDVIPGSSFFSKFYRYHSTDENCKIFLLGAMNGVAEMARIKINAVVGRNIVVGAFSPSYGFEKKNDEIEKIVHIVNESGANVVLVGVGAPKQEKFIMKYKNRMPGVDIWMALGATIDFEAGNISRAPLFMQRCGMEWFYRFVKEPKRMFHRYFVDDVKFFWLFLKQLIGLYKNPFC